MSIDIDSELILLCILFFTGMLTGSTANIRNQQFPPLAQFVANGIFCGFFGIVGGAIPNFFLAEQNHIVTISSGVVCSGAIALFSNEEIKDFLIRIIKRGVATVFNWKLERK